MIPKTSLKDWRRVQRIITKDIAEGKVIRDIRITHSKEDKKLGLDGLSLTWGAASAPAYIGITDLTNGRGELRKNQQMSIFLDDAGATMPTQCKDCKSKYILHSNALVSIQPGERATISTGVDISLPAEMHARICDNPNGAVPGLQIVSNPLLHGCWNSISITVKNTTDSEINIQTGEAFAAFNVFRAVEQTKLRMRKDEKGIEEGGCL